jgi:hypothetical protein
MSGLDLSGAARKIGRKFARMLLKPNFGLVEQRLSKL